MTLQRVTEGCEEGRADGSTSAGTLVYDSMLMKPKLSDETKWHFHFHNAQNNLAESLTAGRERLNWAFL